jgi:hypothetical protein
LRVRYRGTAAAAAAAGFVAACKTQGEQQQRGWDRQCQQHQFAQRRGHYSSRERGAQMAAAAAAA